jgi:DNA-directed RNA polymerase subunit omega
MKLKDGFDSNYRYVLVAARRARQLSGGAPPLVTTNARKVCKIAQEEIDAGKIQYVKPAAPAAAEEPEKPEK